MNRKKGPALYELIHAKPEQAKPRKATKIQLDDDNLEHNLLTPGRSIRMSVGSIGVIAAICIAMIVISYTMGYRKGAAVSKEDYGNRLFEELPQAAFIEFDSQAKTSESSQKQAISSSSRPSWGSVMSDPRVVGYNYYTIMQTTKDGALQLASFCRQKGLEAYVISGNNTRLYLVIALPGSVGRNDAVAIETRSKILAIGQDWANTNAGRGSDLQDSYQMLYN